MNEKKLVQQEAHLPAPLGWWTDELEKIFNAREQDTITLDMKRAAGIALKIARGQRWDEAAQEWQHPAAVPQAKDLEG